MKSFLAVAAVALSVAFVASQQDTSQLTKAKVFLQGKGKIVGQLNLTQWANGVKIDGQVWNLTPGKHGFHVHQWGDIFTDGCGSTGGHYNPAKLTHGAPDSEERHVGDLGNIVAGENGVSDVNVFDKLISLTRDNPIVGRAIVVHAGEDDLGTVDDEGSKKTGNAGGRVACGIVALVP